MANIKLNNNEYLISDSALATPTADFIAHLATIVGNGLKVVVGGVEYGIDSNKISGAISSFEATLSELSGRNDTPSFKYGDIIEDGDLIYTQGGGIATLEEARAVAKPMAEELIGSPWDEIVAIYGGGDEESVWQIADGMGVVDFGLTEATFVPVESRWTVCEKDKSISGDIIIKDKFMESPVTIQEDSFRDCVELTSVTISEGITKVPTGSFKNCSGIKTLIIPSSVTDINIDLRGYSSLENLTVPFIGNGATYMLRHLFGTTEYDNSYAIRYSKTQALYYYLPLGLKNITISGGSIEENDFSGITSLVTFNVLNNVTGNIMANAFTGCTNLTNVVIGDGITSIGERAFSGCYGISNLTIGKGITNIGQYAFAGSSNLTNLYFNAINCADLLNTSTFTDLGSNTDGASVVFGNDVKKIPARLFYTDTVERPNITEIIIGNSVIEIGESAFNYCKNLTNVTIGNNVTSIGKNAFSECSNLTSITIPDSVTDIGNNAFSNTGLTNVTIPDNVTSLGTGAFANNKQLVSVTIGNGIESIPGALFANCSVLTNIIFNGTMAQWNALEKDESWNFEVSATYVQCTDGQVAL